MQIRLMTQHDVEFAVKLAAQEEWTSENQDVFRAFQYHDPQGCFIAEKNNDPVGICVATAYFHAGFFGELIVSPAHRGQGIGAKLLETAMDYLKKRNMRSIYLDAVPAAIPLYERHGFHQVCASYRLTGTLEGKEDPRVRAMRKWDLDSVCQLDRKVFGEDRHFFLKWISFIGPDFAKVLTHNDTIIGFITGRYTQNGISIGPWIMPSDIQNPEGLLLSLAAEVRNEPLNIGVLETNENAIKLLQFFGFQKKQNPPIRMAWGVKDDLGTSLRCFSIGSPAKG